MRTVTVQMTVPEGMIPYLENTEQADDFARNAMLLYPLIQSMTISHGMAAEILGVSKTDLIEYYGTLGIPYLNQSKEELLSDLDTLYSVLRNKS